MDILNKNKFLGAVMVMIVW